MPRAPVFLFLATLFVLACIPLATFTGKMRDQSGLARMEWEAGQRTLPSKDRCAKAALAAIHTAQRAATGPVAHVSKSLAEQLSKEVVAACVQESPSHASDMGGSAGPGDLGGARDGGQEGARGG